MGLRRPRQATLVADLWKTSKQFSTVWDRGHVNVRTAYAPTILVVKLRAELAADLPIIHHRSFARQLPLLKSDGHLRTLEGDARHTQLSAPTETQIAGPVGRIAKYTYCGG
jgi:hypothetical protein